MENPNDRQVGGDHYAGAYQHWDFVEDAGLRYLPGNATKYVARWRKKNGRQDLEKAVHYLDKCIERGVPAPKWNDAIGYGSEASPLEKFLDAQDFPLADRQAIIKIVMGEYSAARRIVMEELLAEAAMAEQTG